MLIDFVIQRLYTGVRVKGQSKSTEMLSVVPYSDERSERSAERSGDTYFIVMGVLLLELTSGNSCAKCEYEPPPITCSDPYSDPIFCLSTVAIATNAKSFFNVGDRAVAYHLDGGLKHSFINHHTIGPTPIRKHAER